MSYFRKLTSQIEALEALFQKDASWLIVINADPDAIASAFALRRIMAHKVKSSAIARVNEIRRPDNLAMLRHLRIQIVPWEPHFLTEFQHFAIVDSQPHHHPVFESIPFSLVIDHHPLLPEKPLQATFADVRAEYGATSTLLTEYLYNMRIRPGVRLATALQYGIRTDTGTFGRMSSEVDLRAYHYLNRFADSASLMRILRSEYLAEWLPYFSRAFENLRRCGSGHFTAVGKVSSADVLVVVADFFLKVHGLHFVTVCGVQEQNLVIIFRGDGSTDLGKLASLAFEAFGSAGGHKAMARAEIDLERIKTFIPKTFLKQHKIFPLKRQSAHVNRVESFAFERIYEALLTLQKEDAPSVPEGFLDLSYE